MSHLGLMVHYSWIVAVFFALLWREETSERVRLFLQIFFGMVLGAMAIGWLMAPFPSGPPTPIP